ncbi:MAG: sensor histidine kinase [Candidatus Acetothermia bacterium]|jgi:signal transduction histidine kinase|nr:sensor histidine kinase [Candidatus Acetothermia bacterium]
MGDQARLVETRAIIDRTFLIRRITLGAFCGVALAVVGFPGFPWNPLFAVPFAWLLLTVPFQRLLHRQRTLRALNNVHAAFFSVEIVLVTYLVHRLGGVEWVGVVFYLYTVMYANFFLPKVAGYVVTALAVGGYALVAFLEYFGLIPHVSLFPLVRPPHRDLAYVLTTVLAGGIGLYAVLAFTVRAFADVYEQKRRELVRRERALARLSARLLSAQEEERRRIARRLHDELGQTLAAARWALAGGDPREAERLLALGVEGTRSLARDLRPPLLDELGLEPALRHLAERFSASAGVEVEVDLPGQRLPEAVEIAVFRVVQEALENVRRHARAHQVRVQVEVGKGEVIGEVEDDGQGFDPDGTAEGLGLSGMREWVGLLGGELAVRSAPGRGTRVWFRVPLS